MRCNSFAVWGMHFLAENHEPEWVFQSDTCCACCQLLCSHLPYQAAAFDLALLFFLWYSASTVATMGHLSAWCRAVCLAAVLTLAAAQASNVTDDPYVGFIR